MDMQHVSCTASPIPLVWISASFQKHLNRLTSTHLCSAMQWHLATQVTGLNRSTCLESIANGLSITN